MRKPIYSRDVRFQARKDIRRKDKLYNEIHKPALIYYQLTVCCRQPLQHLVDRVFPHISLCNDRWSFCPVPLQLMGSFVLAVGLWLRFDPETVSLLNGDKAPDTFFIGEYQSEAGVQKNKLHVRHKTVDSIHVLKH